MPSNYNPADHYVQTLAIVPGDEVNCRERVEAITSKYKLSPEGMKMN